jgi:hypothetical protein
MIDAPHYEDDDEVQGEWFDHYMAIDAEDLAMEFLSASLREKREVSDAMRKAAEQRINEIERALLEPNE